MTSSGVSNFIAGGGGGGEVTSGTLNAAGGSGGGGQGGFNGVGGNGTANTGGGGGGGGYSGAYQGGGNGGSGLFIIVYKTADFTSTGGSSTGTSGSETWVKFTANGTLVLTAKGGGGTTAPNVFKTAFWW
jgi:hypothetical protein